jgi:hypothetical protein
VAEPGIPGEVRQLVARHVTTMEHVEVLLLLARAPERWRDVEEIRTELRLPATALSPKVFAGLEGAGLVEADGRTPPSYRYAPATAELRRAVELLAVSYNERPVTLVRMIYERPSAVQTFADAFRIRKEGDT